MQKPAKSKAYANPYLVNNAESTYTDLVFQREVVCSNLQLRESEPFKAYFFLGNKHATIGRGSNALPGMPPTAS